MDDFLRRKLAACQHRLNDLDRVFVAAHNALQLPCFRRKQCTDVSDRWYHSRAARRNAIVAIEIALFHLNWDLPHKRTGDIERVYTEAQYEIRQLSKSWDRYMNKVNRLCRIHHRRTYSIPFPDGDLTERYDG